MATNLADLVPSLKREVAIPGTFDDVYPDTTNNDLVGSLEDAFGAAQIDGFFLTQSLDLTTHEVTPDLSTAGRAAVAIYAAERILTMQIMSLKQRVAYEAGPVKYETENSASVLAEILKQLAARKRQVLASAEEYRRLGTFAMSDMYADRLTGLPGEFVSAPEFYPYELIGN